MLIVLLARIGSAIDYFGSGLRSKLLQLCLQEIAVLVAVGLLLVLLYWSSHCFRRSSVSICSRFRTSRQRNGHEYQEAQKGALMKRNLGAVMTAAIPGAMRIGNVLAGRPDVGAVMKASMKTAKIPSMKVMKVSKPHAMGIPPMKSSGKPLRSFLNGFSQSGSKRDKKSGPFPKSPSIAQAGVNYDKPAEKDCSGLSQRCQPEDKKHKGPSFFPKVTGTEDEDFCLKLRLRVISELG